MAPEDPAAHLLRARHYLNDLNFDDAHHEITAALKLDNANIAAFELLGEVLVEQDNPEEARKAFRRAIELEQQSGTTQTTSSFEKYLWMGQLSEEGGEASIAYYKVGVKRFIKFIGQQQEEDQYPLRARLASVYSAMAELYMTDLCMTENAEEQCEKYVTNALLAHDRSPEALQTFASMRLSQVRIEDAKEKLATSMSIWEDQVPGTPEFPTYASRLSLVRLLLECEMTEDAFRVLQQLQQEDDEVVELWYLFGWTYYLQGENSKDLEKRREAWEDSRDCLHKCQSLYQRMDWDDEALKEHASDLLANIHAFGISIEFEEPHMNATEEEDDSGDEEHWESDEDEMDED